MPLGEAPSAPAVTQGAVTEAAAPAPPTPLPPLRDDLEFYPSARTADGAPTWVVYDPTRYRYFNIGQIEFELLRRWRQCTAAELLQRVNGETSMRLGADALDRLLKFLAQHELLRVEGPEAVQKFTGLYQAARQSLPKQLLHKYLFFRVPLVHPDRFLSATLPLLRPLLHPATLLLLGLLGLLGVYLVSRQWESFLGTLPYLFSLEGLLAFVVALSLAKVAHELGHAYTAKYFGLEVATMGVAFLVMWPVLYTDTSNAWRLTSRRQRLLIDAAGMAVELALAVLATLLWSFLPDGPLRSAVFMIAAVTWISTLLVNLSPFMRFDGYYLLTDLLGVNNLQDRSFALARWWLREQLFGFGDPVPEYFPPRRYRILLVYAFSTWIYRLILFLGIALIVYFFFFKVLGIFLMLVEVVWFIGRPVYKELTEWWKRRHDMRINRHSLATLALLALLLGLLATPWQSRLQAPAVYRGLSEHRVYTPQPGRIQSLHLERGQRVNAGDTLLVLDDPELEYNLESAQRREELLRLQLALQSADKAFLDRTRVLRNQLAETQAKITSYQDQRQRLRITAPAAGIVAEVTEALQVGRWINPGQWLALLVDTASGQVVAYLDEADVALAAPGTDGRFYPDDPARAPLTVRVTDIDSANISQFQPTDYYVASTYQGPVPVRQSQQRLVPDKATYRARLQILDNAAAPAQVMRGSVVVEGSERRSLLGRAWVWVGAILVRESGF